MLGSLSARLTSLDRLPSPELLARIAIFEAKRSAPEHEKPQNASTS